jgi:transposase-like protein
MTNLSGEGGNENGNFLDFFVRRTPAEGNYYVQIIASMDIFLLSLSLFSIETYLSGFSDLVFPPLACPRCNECTKIIRHGYYYRRAIDAAGEQHLIPIRRFRCKTCKKTFSYLPPFLARYKPFCIQVVCPILETYVTTTLSLSKIVDVKYPDLPIDYRSVRSCIRHFVSKLGDIYSLVMTELVKSDFSWDLSKDLRFLQIPDPLEKKLPNRGFLDLYRFFVLMGHYISVVQTRRSQLRLLQSPWLLLANYILFVRSYSTIF